jgi:pyruvate formate lyase activating enzyme
MRTLLERAPPRAQFAVDLFSTASGANLVRSWLQWVASMRWCSPAALASTHCKQLGLHTRLDTSGRLGDRFSDEDVMNIDLHLLDIKSGNPEIYKTVTNPPLQPALDFAPRLSALKRPMWIRFVLVPGVTDDIVNVEKVADLCAGLQSVERVEILRFHQMDRDKWQKLGLEYTLANVGPPNAELTERVRGQFLSRGLTVY